MEKDYIRFFEYFDFDMRDQKLFLYFYISICGNLWYHKKDNILFFESNVNHWFTTYHQNQILDSLQEYRLKKFFTSKEERFHIHSRILLLDITYGDIHKSIEELDQFNDFIILPYTPENLISFKRESLINKII